MINACSLILKYLKLRQIRHRLPKLVPENTTGFKGGPRIVRIRETKRDRRRHITAPLQAMTAVIGHNMKAPLGWPLQRRLQEKINTPYAHHPSGKCSNHENEYVAAIYTEAEGITNSFHVPALTCFAHFSNCLLDVGEEAEHMSVGVDFDRLHIFSFNPRRAFSLDWTSRWRRLCHVSPIRCRRAQ